jgi:hypothetical protein
VDAETLQGGQNSCIGECPAAMKITHLKGVLVRSGTNFAIRSALG